MRSSTVSASGKLEALDMRVEKVTTSGGTSARVMRSSTVSASGKLEALDISIDQKKTSPQLPVTSTSAARAWASDQSAAEAIIFRNADRSAKSRLTATLRAFRLSANDPKSNIPRTAVRAPRFALLAISSKAPGVSSTTLPKVARAFSSKVRASDGSSVASAQRSRFCPIARRFRARPSRTCIASSSCLLSSLS